MRWPWRDGHLCSCCSALGRLVVDEVDSFLLPLLEGVIGGLGTWQSVSRRGGWGSRGGRPPSPSRWYMKPTNYPNVKISSIPMSQAQIVLFCHGRLKCWGEDSRCRKNRSFNNKIKQHMAPNKHNTNHVPTQPHSVLWWPSGHTSGRLWQLYVFNFSSLWQQKMSMESPHHGGLWSCHFQFSKSAVFIPIVWII